jgi:hypothetical protein
VHQAKTGEEIGVAEQEAKQRYAFGLHPSLIQGKLWSINYTLELDLICDES